MKIKTKALTACLLTACLIPLTVSAQDFDNRWYGTLGAGANIQDDDRDTENTIFGTIGVGKSISPQWSVDMEANYQRPKANRNEDLSFSQYGVSVDARRHFRAPGRTLNPYIVGGVGYQRAEEEYESAVLPSPRKSKRDYPTVKLGAGLQADFAGASLRGEIAARHSFDDESLIAPGEKGFTDTLASLSLVVPFGASPAPVIIAEAPPAVPQPSACSFDDDGDGVNNCLDRCVSERGTMVDSNGCPVPVTIDLRGVNFDFDKASLRPESFAILNETAEILRRHPQIQLEVAGHTDLCGSDAYNQGLSERRARTVYNYLIQQGVDASRLRGPFGYGEERPLVNTPQSFPACKSETNRRTELNVQN